MTVVDPGEGPSLVFTHILKIGLLNPTPNLPFRLSKTVIVFRRLQVLRLLAKKWQEKKLPPAVSGTDYINYKRNMLEEEQKVEKQKEERKRKRLENKKGTEG